MSYLCNQNKTISMKNIYKVVFLALLILASCGHKKTVEQAKPVDTIPLMVMQIQKCSRLYTAEAHIHKIVTHDDQIKLKGSFLRQDFDIAVPGSSRKVAIPMDATVKAYVDFKDFSAKNVSRHGGKIEIILPDPKVTLTATKIDHDGVKQFVSLARRNFSDEELSRYEQQGRESIIKDIPQMNLLETARINAAHTLVPMLVDMGFKEADITVSFRKKFTLQDLKSLIETSTSVEKPTNKEK